ncbi:MAG TPA: hypothetical protein VJ464_10925 [Blastocatellia bacterium]|nr:hypothetical protein [Blastocatellia bacterium]
MLHRLAALVIVLAFIGPELAGGLVCAESSGCHGMARMACCAMAKSPAASPAAMLCCQTVCGESTDDTPTAQPQASAQQLDFSQPTVRVRVEPSDRLFAAQLAVSMRSAESALLYHDPPDLFLHHSTFLI